ncbi:hypothetical protein FKV68_19695 [Sinorhizobium mexicanum]|uniref:Uncharacterized protein n=1 Tax=Sinorhizobium mexicanum TaxID=375549 RepID=A0A859QDP4_9HYPH|nr:hypothetical protein FKV68_19695 [Sinorhizobium mexicanum]
MANAAAKHRAIGERSLAGKCRFDLKSEKGAACLFLARLPEEKKRHSVRPGPYMQAPALAQGETVGIAADFQNDGREDRYRKSRFGNPERILDRAYRNEQEALDVEPIGFEARRIGKPGLARGKRLADPKDRRQMTFLLLSPLTEYRKRRHETGGGTRIARFDIADFRHALERQPAVEHVIERRDAKGQDLVAGRLLPFAPETGRIGRLGCAHDPGQPSIFNLCYGFAEGKNGFPLHGFLGHDGRLHQMFMLCSYGFQSLPQESTTKFENLFLTRPVQNSTLEKQRRNRYMRATRSAHGPH